jgi:hypothetical protein
MTDNLQLVVGKGVEPFVCCRPAPTVALLGSKGTPSYVVNSPKPMI